MAKKAEEPEPIHGRWHIVSMSAWDEDYINEEVQAFIEFEENGTAASSSSATSRGRWTADLTTRDGEPAVEWSWDGNDEMDAGTGPRLGRGEGRRTARHDLLPPGRRVRVRGEKGDGEEGNEAEVSGTWQKNTPG